MSRFLCCCLCLLASPAAAEFVVRQGDYYERLTGLDTASQSIRITGGRVDVLEVGGTIGLTIDGGSIGELQSTGNADVLIRTGDFEIESPIHLTDVFELTFDAYSLTSFGEIKTQDGHIQSDWAAWMVDFTYLEFSFTYNSPGPVPNVNNTSREHFPGDAQGDGVVDLTDLNNVRNYFGENGENWEYAWEANTNGDCCIDLEDLNNVRNNFGADYRTSQNPVPEPATLVLLLAGMTVLTLLKSWRCSANPGALQSP